MNLLGPVANYWMWTTKPCQDVEQKGCKFAANAKQSLVITTDCNLLFVGHGAVDLDVYCLVITLN